MYKQFLFRPCPLPLYCFSFPILIFSTYLYTNFAAGQINNYAIIGGALH